MSLLRVNHNISSMIAHRSLGQVDNRVQQNLERLSTGLRINRAWDDAAGLSISETMRAQIGGLRRSILNAQDALGLATATEGALGETHVILQRMRELAIHAANNTQDVQADQDEIETSIEELGRIARETQYANRRLLNGDNAVAAAVSDGYKKKGVSVVNVREATLSNGEHVLQLTRLSAGGITMLATGASNVELVSGGSTFADGLHTLSVENVVAQATEQWRTEKFTYTSGTVTGVTAVSGTLLTSVTNVILDEGDVIDFSVITWTGTQSIVGSHTIVAGNTIRDLISSIEAAGVTGAGYAVSFVASAGAIQVQDPTVGYSQTVFSISPPSFADGEITTSEYTAGEDNHALVSIDGGTAVTVYTGDTNVRLNGANGEEIVAHFTGGPLTEGEDKFFVREQAWAARLDGGELKTFRNGAQELRFIAGGSNAGQQIYLNFDAELTEGTTVISVQNNQLNFHVGANKDQTIQVAIGNMDPSTLGYEGVSGMTVSDINVTTVSGAEKAIDILDRALSQVSRQRSLLGSFGTRLQHSIANLGVAEENLQASESRIRDVDFAEEMANYVRNQILVQAGTAMLAQANVAPQAVLQLLA